jgi:hypothetical protein
VQLIRRGPGAPGMLQSVRLVVSLPPQAPYSTPRDVPQVPRRRCKDPSNLRTRRAMTQGVPLGPARASHPTRRALLGVAPHVETFTDVTVSMTWITMIIGERPHLVHVPAP